MRVAVLGAGAIGWAAAAELALAGHEVRLWGRSRSTLEPLIEAGGVPHDGVLGSGSTELAAVSDQLSDVLQGADAALVCLPAIAHEDLAVALARAGASAPVILNPGGVGGTLHFTNTLAREGARLELAELSTATHVARIRDGRVSVTGRAGRLWGAAHPGGERALGLAQALFAAITPATDTIATGLANVNLVLHPPGAILASAWIEATNGDFRFYGEGTTPAVVKAIRRLDEERLAVAAAFGHDQPSLLDEMAAIGTVDAGGAARGDWLAALSQGEQNRTIRAPDSLEHRYYREDFGFGLVPFDALAKIAGVDVPFARALLEVGRTICDFDPVSEGRTAQRMGIEGLDRDELLALVHSGAAVDSGPQ